MIRAEYTWQLLANLPCLFALVLLRAACSRWPRAGAAIVPGGGVFLLAAVGLLPQSPLG